MASGLQTIVEDVVEELKEDDIAKLNEITTEKELLRLRKKQVFSSTKMTDALDPIHLEVQSKEIKEMNDARGSRSVMLERVIAQETGFKKQKQLYDNHLNQIDFLPDDGEHPEEVADQLY